jgi:branched-chain amino acid transport system permease protein
VRAWVLNGIISAAGGALFAWWIGTISPTDFFLAPTFALIVMFVVGGSGTVGGAVLGAALVTAVQDGLRQYEDNHVNLGAFSISRLTGLTQFVLVLLILVVMAFRREGLIARREPDEVLRRLLGRARRRPHAPAAPTTEP